MPKIRQRNRRRSPRAPENNRVAKRTPHAEVERKYRDALNDEFENLRQSIPHIAKLDDQVKGNRSKTSKAVVLSTAVSYINRLEANVEKLKEEQFALRSGTRVPKRDRGERGGRARRGVA
jgi:hypothetical protein